MTQFAFLCCIMRIIQRPRAVIDWSKYKEEEKQGYDVPDSWSFHASFQKSYQLRLNTFSGMVQFPLISQKPEEFAKCSFKYMGRSDHVECVHCSTVLGEWKPEDNINDLHAFVTPDCPGVLRKK